jgi:NhaP-type Na+/H+ or K+/H+ antiporter
MPSLGLLSVLFPVLNFVSCLAISACLTPTDPIICTAIVGEIYNALVFETMKHMNMSLGGRFAQKHVPVNLRQLLAAESAANDGLAYPFLTLAIYLTIDSSRETALTHWVLVGWLCALNLSPQKKSSLSNPGRR